MYKTLKGYGNEDKRKISFSDHVQVREIEPRKPKIKLNLSELNIINQPQQPRQQPQPQQPRQQPQPQQPQQQQPRQQPRQQPQQPRQQPQQPRQQPQQQPRQQPQQPHARTRVNPSSQSTKRNTFTNNPLVWGPDLWNILHTVSVMYPDSPTEQYRQQMQSAILTLPVLIPCASCQEHSSLYINETFRTGELQNATQSKSRLFDYFVDFHNNVNKRLGKPEMSKEDAVKNYFIV